METKQVPKALNKYVIYKNQYGDEAVYVFKAYRCYKNHHDNIVHCAELESLKANSRVTVGLESIRLAGSDTIMGMIRS